MFVYRFLDKNENVIYVGKTNNLKRRIDDHKNNGHLNEQAYKEIEAIEYLEFTNEIDQHLAEIYFIGKYKPKYNTVYNDKGALTIKADIGKGWQLYMYKGEYMKVLRDKMSKIKEELKENEHRLKEVQKLIDKKNSIIKDLVKLEERKVSKINELTFKKEGLKTHSKVKDLKDGWWVSPIYNDIRKEAIVIVKEEGKITTIYVGEKKYEDKKLKYGSSGSLGENIGFLTERIQIENLWLDWIDIDKDTKKASINQTQTRRAENEYTGVSKGH